MQSNVALKVNESGLFQALRSAFSSASVLGELMQNARRAGSDWVSFNYDGTDLVIQDGGNGVGDLQNLLTAAASGWDDATKDAERPFGLGFLATLYSAKQVTVMSRQRGASTGYTFTADTEQLLAGASFVVEEVSMVEGTVIKLWGFSIEMLERFEEIDKRIFAVSQALQRVSTGFPIPVFFNDLPMGRGEAVDSDFHQTDVGLMKINLDTANGERIYVQGLPLEGNNWAQGRTIVHLDNSFAVKLPDRQHLVNASRDLKRIEAAKKSLARSLLEQAKVSMDPEHFLLQHAEHCQMWGAKDLMDDIPVALGSWFVDWSVADPGHLEPYMSIACKDGFLSREELERAGVFHLSEEDQMHERVWQSVARHFTLSGRADYLLGESHWLKQLAKSIEPPEGGDEAMRLILGAEIGSAGVDTWNCHKMIVMESLSIEHIATGEAHEVDATFDEVTGRIYLTRGAYAPAHIGLVSDFVSDDRLDEEAKAQGEVEFGRVHAQIIATDPANLLHIILNQAMTSDNDRLAGRSFTVTFGEGGRPTAVVETPLQ